MPTPAVALVRWSAVLFAANIDFALEEEVVLSELFCRELEAEFVAEFVVELDPEELQRLAGPSFPAFIPEETKLSRRSISCSMKLVPCATELLFCRSVWNDVRFGDST